MEQHHDEKSNFGGFAVVACYHLLRALKVKAELISSV
jgi:hypothetical protein